MRVLTVSEFSEWHEAHHPEYIFSTDNQEDDAYRDLRLSLHFRGLDSRPDLRQLRFSNGEDTLYINQIKEIHMYDDTKGFVIFLDIISKHDPTYRTRILCWLQG